LYTPERSGLPSEVRGTGLVAGAAAAAVTGAVPATVTVTSRVSVVLFGPSTVNVYVVVALGVTSRVPRGVTRPGSGLIVTPLGFSVAQTKVAD
jgi:hypothetical protein